MQSTTFIETTTKDGKPISVRLGDVFIMKSEFAAIKSDTDVSNYIILGLLAVAIVPADPRKYKSSSRVYFSMIGMDRLRYSVSRRTENGLILLDRGKEIELDERYILRAIKALSGGRSSGIIGGLELYIRTIITSPSKIKAMSMHKLPTRLVDLSKWPSLSLRQWAIYHLGILRRVPPVGDMVNKTDMINSMIKLAVSARRSGNPDDRIRSMGNPGGMMRGMSTLGVATGRISGGPRNRLGKMQGVPFINLSPNEIKFPPGGSDYIEVYPRSDIHRVNVNPYMIVCINGEAQWVLISEDMRPHGHMVWTFHNGRRLTIGIKTFNKDLSDWLRAAHGVIGDVVDEEAEEAVEEVDSVRYFSDEEEVSVKTVVEHNTAPTLYGASPEPVMAVEGLPILKDEGCAWVDDTYLGTGEPINQAIEESIVRAVGEAIPPAKYRITNVYGGKKIGDPEEEI